MCGESIFPDSYTQGGVMNLRKYQKIYLSLFALYIVVIGLNALLRYAEYSGGLMLSIPSPWREKAETAPPQDDTHRIIPNGPANISPHPLDKEKSESPRVISNRGISLSD